MGIFQDIERLIAEHGSASILRERLALAKDQYTALEKQNAALKESEANLKAENKRLNLDIDECQKQRRALEEKLSHKNPPNVATGGSWTKARKGDS
jgi:predicted  nucleic acid-binding Zn-ribbon protein